MPENQRSDRILGLLALSVLGGGCLWVLWPFMSAVLWAVILSSVTWPAFIWLDRRVGGRRTLSASLMTLLVTLVVVVPFVGVLTGLADNVSELGLLVSGVLKDGLPEAPAWLEKLPLIGESTREYWQQFVHNGERLVGELAKLAEPARNAAWPSSFSSTAKHWPSDCGLPWCVSPEFAPNTCCVSRAARSPA
jgi:predicted PurR-regulated permease PerM